MVQSTDEFLDKIKNYRFNPNQMLVSFDVVSSFTNVPLTETIEIIAEKIFSKIMAIHHQSEKIYLSN